MSQKDFFKPLSEIDKNSILDYIQNTSVDCVVKIFDTYSKTQFLKTKKDTILISKINSTKADGEKILVSFESIGDYFFFESTVHIQDTVLNVTLPEQIFKLHRRNDFRLPIPIQMKPVIKLKDYPELKTNLRDMSMGGCRIELKTEFKLNVELEQESEIEIKVLDFQEKKLAVIIKFIDIELETKTVLLGLKFKELNSHQNGLMQNTLLQIDRMFRQRN